MARYSSFEKYICSFLLFSLQNSTKLNDSTPYIIAVCKCVCVFVEKEKKHKKNNIPLKWFSLFNYLVFKMAIEVYSATAQSQAVSHKVQLDRVLKCARD